MKAEKADRARRGFLASVAGGAAALALPMARAQVAMSAPGPTLEQSIAEVTKGAPAKNGRVKLELPVLADNGNAVPMKVSVDSPMTASDYVKTIYLLSEKNPVRNMATYHFGPRAGRAEVVSRVRLAGSQRVVALAEMSDGAFWLGSTDVVVTLSACMDEPA